jgi:hypothetical protein
MEKPIETDHNWQSAFFFYFVNASSDNAVNVPIITWHSTALTKYTEKLNPTPSK